MLQQVALAESVNGLLGPGNTILEVQSVGCDWSAIRIGTSTDSNCDLGVIDTYESWSMSWL